MNGKKKKMTHRRGKAIGSEEWVRAKDFEVGDTMAVGVYRGTVQSRKGFDYFAFEQEDGTLTKVRANGQLKKALKNIKVGDAIEVVYDGSIILDSGDWEGSECHQFKVYEAILEWYDAEADKNSPVGKATDPDTGEVDWSKVNFSDDAESSEEEDKEEDETEEDEEESDEEDDDDLPWA